MVTNGSGSSTRWESVSTGRGRVLIVRPAPDRIALAEAEALAQALFNTPAYDEPYVLVNLRDIAYISSSGVSLLVRVAAERELHVTGIGTAVRKVLEAIGILDLLKIHATEADALAALGAAEAGR